MLNNSSLGSTSTLILIFSSNTFKSASKSKLLKKIYLTTNDERIIKILPKYKKIKLITRDDKLSTYKSNIKDKSYAR